MTKETKSIIMPVCPHCETRMRPMYFRGYYESFFMWECECIEIPDAEETRGAYA